MSAAALATLAQGAPDSDEVLSRFVGWVAERGLSLYPAQEEAILELASGKHVILNTPTGSGKSLVATALHFKAMAEGRQSFYTCPIKALVNEKFFALCDDFGADNVGMMTGDAAINAQAPIVCCTAEILANLALRDPGAAPPYVVMDEFHYYGDKERGVAWQVPLLLCENTTFLLMSATLGDTSTIEEGLRSITRKDVAVVRSQLRPVPLEFDYRETPLHETIEKLLEAGRAPVYLVNFTQRAAAEQAQNLMSVQLSTKEQKAAIAEALADARFDTPFGKELSRFVRHGVGLHHAGLLPKYRLIVEKLAQQGHLKVVSGTDTLGMGVNIPIRTVVFTQLCKYDGEKTAILGVREFHQIAGRAGRKGFDERGFVVVQAPEHVVENLRLAEKKAAGKKVVMQKPPQKGYAHWDKQTFERLLGKPPEPLESRFTVTHGMLLQLLQGDPKGYRRLVLLIARSHAPPRDKRNLRRTAATYFRALRKAGIIELVLDERARHPLVEVASDLQRDFSLNHTLSMYLVETLPLVDRLDDAATLRHLSILTLVESILENPQVVLFAQLDRLKDEKMTQMKAEGVEYEQRIEELEKMEWPKPMADFVYDTFNAFAAKHPWVGQENIRPKSVARDLLERFCSFHDYIREYGLQRSEGVLLRYLSQVFKTVLQTVPESMRDDALEDVIEFFRAMLRSVDSSLLDEWQSLRGLPGVRVPEPVYELRPRALDEDPKALAVRVRGELHRLLAALANRRWDDALACIVPGDFTAEKLEAALQPYFAEYASIDNTPRARRPDQTLIKPGPEPRTFHAYQRILDPAGDDDWSIECFIDLREAPTDAPLIQLRGVHR
jgi:superfamily II RNA helicase